MSKRVCMSAGKGQKGARCICECLLRNERKRKKNFMKNEVKLEGKKNEAMYKNVTECCLLIIFTHYYVFSSVGHETSSVPAIILAQS